MDERLQEIKERLDEMRRLRGLHVAEVAKTAKTGTEIMLANEPDMYEQDVLWLIQQLEFYVERYRELT